jgi:hypothetical protein
MIAAAAAAAKAQSAILDIGITFLPLAKRVAIDRLNLAQSQTHREVLLPRNRMDCANELSKF